MESSDSTKLSYIGYANLTYEVSSNTVSVSQPVRLSAIEKKLLVALLRNPWDATSREDLFQAVWPETPINISRLERPLRGLRKKLLQAHWQGKIVCVYGKGLCVRLKR